jgi:hypothetical protein
VLKISTGAKRLAVAASLVSKGKHARIDVGASAAPLASAAPCKVSVRPPTSTTADDGYVAYCAMLDSVLSVESCSSSSSDSSSSESILASPRLILDMHISAELQEMPEAEAAEQEAPVEIDAYAVSAEG